MSKNRKNVYLSMSAFTENANKALNKAIVAAETENCGEINEVHLFVSMLDKCEVGNRILS